jgi:16S rRNA (guanine527-N7)-methyltransferase
VKQIDMLDKALHHLGIENSSQVIEKFKIYEQLLLQWNQKINLISKHDEERIVPRHFLESIGFIPSVDFPECARVIDLGSGAGFPGIPIKIIRPDLNIYLVESINKKARFLKTVIDALSLKEIEVICDRAENLANKIDPVDIIVCRSVASLDVLVKWSIGLLKQKTGILAVVKGEKLNEELLHFGKMEKDYRIKNPEIKKFNPFPSICPLDRSYMVIIKNG